MWVRLASWRNQSMSCVSRHWEASLKKRWKEYMNYSSLYRVLFSSLSYLLGCDFCSPTTVSVPVTEFWKETSEWNQSLKKRHYLLKATQQHCRDWGKLSYPQRFPLAFRSSSISGGHMQGKGYEVIWHAMQHFRFLLHTVGADGALNRVVTDEDVSMQQSQACCMHCSQ